jgi:hypothetical protein
MMMPSPAGTAGGGLAPIRRVLRKRNRSCAGGVGVRKRSSPAVKKGRRSSRKISSGPRLRTSGS